MPSSGYAPWSVVADEQPTAAKWNILGSNDASFNNGNGFEDNIIVNRHMADDSVTGDNLSLDRVMTDFLGVPGFTTSSNSYQDPSMKITLPAIGTWLILCVIRSNGNGQGQFGVVQLYNFTTATAIPHTERLSSYASAASERQHPTMFGLIDTTTVNNQVGVRVKSGGAYNHTLENDNNGYGQIIALRVG